MSRDSFKFDSFLIYILGFLFGNLLAMGLIFMIGGVILLQFASNYTNWAVFFCGVGLCALGIVGGIAVWLRCEGRQVGPRRWGNFSLL